MAEELPAPPALHPALSRNTGFLVSRMGLFASKRFGERIATIGLTTRMWGALNVLVAEGPITQQALGKSIGMDPSSMVSTIDELESRGLVERRRHPADRRAYALHVTDGGHETLARGRELAREAQDELLAPLTAGERDQLRELLLKLAIASQALTVSAD
jgi:DNA-binding MarR family transcriptional regulator